MHVVEPIRPSDCPSLMNGRVQHVHDGRRMPPPTTSLASAPVFAEVINQDESDEHHVISLTTVAMSIGITSKKPKESRNERQHAAVEPTRGRSDQNLGLQRAPTEKFSDGLPSDRSLERSFATTLVALAPERLGDGRCPPAPCQWHPPGTWT